MQSDQPPVRLRLTRLVGVRLMQGFWTMLLMSELGAEWVLEELPPASHHTNSSDSKSHSKLFMLGVKLASRLKAADRLTVEMKIKAHPLSVSDWRTES